jgi:hypothetical protein
MGRTLGWDGVAGCVANGRTSRGVAKWPELAGSGLKNEESRIRSRPLRRSPLRVGLTQQAAALFVSSGNDKFAFDESGCVLNQIP